MASFTVRVEMQNADWDDYESLHKKMAAKKYYRQVEATSGTTYQLPDAEYVHSSTTKDEGKVADEVKAIADSVKKSSRVLVTKSAGRAIRGLKAI
ncbi:type V toxin-antitoxin system endoribonuclease antitoxin GhoS [Citrobacter amalonaticus]